MAQRDIAARFSLYADELPLITDGWQLLMILDAKTAPKSQRTVIVRLLNLGVEHLKNTLQLQAEEI